MKGILVEDQTEVRTSIRDRGQNEHRTGVPSGSIAKIEYNIMRHAACRWVEIDPKKRFVFILGEDSQSHAQRWCSFDMFGSFSTMVWF